MKNLNKITKILGVTFVLAASGVASAATVSSTATATVQNAFTITEDTELSFGTIRATAEPLGTNVATLVLAADGSVTTPAPGVNSALTQLLPGSVGQFSISNAAAYTNLTITDPSDFELTNGTAPGTSPTFDVTTFTYIIRGGANDGAAYTGTTTGALQTDATGAVSFDMGATLSTDSDTSSTSYIDADYTGTYNMLVSY